MKHLILFFIAFACFSCASKVYNDGYITYAPVQLTEDEKQSIAQSLESLDKRYDSEGKMLTENISGWGYHRDATNGVFHAVRSSFGYAVTLMDFGTDESRQRAFDVIEKTISLQDVNPDSKSCGVWPYYEEEPLATKLSPIDYNWADFNAVSLLDIYMGHKDEIPADLLKKIENALVLAGRAIQKRNVDMGYTNIAIMGTYTTYVIAHLFDIPDLKDYARTRLKRFYDYTMEKNGFTEYNSPTYTIVSLNELELMKRHIVEPAAKKMIDELYALSWEIIARHFHQPTAQWAGPHSRSYNTLAGSSFYTLLNQASNGRIDISGNGPVRKDAKANHQIPEHLFPYFLTPEYPRTETDVFENKEPQTIGTCYLTDKYALSSVNRASFWNQRRPFVAYWGTPENPSYLQVRFLHELYDLSAATFFSQQKEQSVLSAINFITDGGDKHINIDILKDGKLMAKDLRLRFEFGNTDVKNLKLPAKNDAPFSFDIDGLQFNICLFHSVFGKYKGYWEKGGDDQTAWLDFVLYAGKETEIDLMTIEHAALGFTFCIGSCPQEPVKYTVSDGMLDAGWNGLKINIPVKPDKNPGNL